MGYLCQISPVRRPWTWWNLGNRSGDAYWSILLRLISRMVEIMKWVLILSHLRWFTSSWPCSKFVSFMLSYSLHYCFLSQVTEASLVCTDEPQSLNWDMQQDSDILGLSFLPYMSYCPTTAYCHVMPFCLLIWYFGIRYDKFLVKWGTLRAIR